MSSGTPPFASAPSGSRKVAIPRLQRPSQTQNQFRDRRRVPRACTACRSHKIKCTGDTPRCKHCEVTGRECIYIMPRKDRLKNVTERCVQMAALLNDLKRSVNDEGRARIGELLDAIEDDVSDIRQTPVSSIPDTDAESAKESNTTIDATPSIESLGALGTEPLDLVDEDLLKDEWARATGFVGKNSEVQWLRSIMLQLDRTDEDAAKLTSAHGLMAEWRGPNYGSGGVEQVSSYTFYLDSEKVDLDFFVDPYELPPPETVERLLGCYMATVHDSFPILPRKLFEDQVKKYFNTLQKGNSMRLSPKWQAILNLVFAIGAKYSHLAAASWAADERDHLIYQARARAFGLNESALTSHPDVPQIQVTGLLAFYYLSVGQISRAWVVLGIALRFAYALGLHIRNEDPSATPTKREMLVRIWWSLYTLERLLSSITGRPSIIVGSCCSVPLPIPLAEEQIDDLEVTRIATPTSPSTSSSSAAGKSPTSSGRLPFAVDTPYAAVGPGIREANSGSYFRAVAQIGIITQNILSSLYSAGTMIRSPGEIQQDIVQLGQRIEQWATNLPPEFNFQQQGPGSTAPRSFVREHMLLGFSFCSARMLLTRPCLSGLGQEINDLNPATSFTRRMAHICIDAAKMVADFLPEEPHPLLLYERGPWWSVVHHMMQAVSVILLGITHMATTPSPEIGVLAQYAKKFVRWLRVMPDPLAERAYRTALSTLQAVATRLSLDISDLWVEDPMAFPSDLSGVSGASQFSTGSGIGPQMQSQFVPAGAIPGFPSQGGAPLFEGHSGPYFHGSS